MLTLPVLDEVELLQHTDDILGLYTGDLTDVLDTDLALVFPKHVQNHLRPVAAIAEQTQIT
jgi:hypothetical protein